MVVLSSLALLLIGSIGPEPASAASSRVQHEQVLDYKLGPGDVVSIQVLGQREFEQTTRVSNSGRIHVPFVGIMLVAGLTSVELEGEIARLIKEHELIKEPSVRVQVAEHRSQPVYAIGEVNAPGQFVITGDMYLLDLLSKAGGLLAAADETGFLYRRNSLRPAVAAKVIGARDRAAVVPSKERATGSPVTMSPSARGVPDEEVLQINFRDLREGTRPELNVKVRGGDVLYVPRMRQQNIYLIGELKNPGAYTLPRRGQLTAAQAIIYAGGPLPTAKMSSGFLVRHNESGERESVPVDFAAIIEGRRPDIPVYGNDIIFVPNSKIKTIGVGLLNLGPRLLQQFLIF